MIYDSNRIPEKPAQLKMSGHVVICNWNECGLLLVEQFHGPKSVNRRDVVLVTPDADTISAPDPFDTSDDRCSLYGLSFDPAHDSSLRRADVDTASAVIILADHDVVVSQDSGTEMNPSDARSVLISLAAHRVNPDVWICSELLEEHNRDHLEQAYVNEIISTEDLSSRLMAQATLTPGLTHVYREMLANTGMTSEPYVIDTPAEFIGCTIRTVRRLALGHQVIPIGYRSRHAVMVNPGLDVVIEHGSQIMLLAVSRPDAEEALRRMIGEGAREYA